VTNDVATGFVVLHVRLTLQLLAPAAILHEGDMGVSVPDMAAVPGEAARASSAANMVKT
jgi:hypothetical protein